MCPLTLHNNNTVSGVWPKTVGGRALVLATVAGLAVDDLDGDDAVGVGDGVQVGIQGLARLKQEENILEIVEKNI